MSITLKKIPSLSVVISSKDILISTLLFLTSLFSFCSAQSLETRTDAGQIPQKIIRENIPYFVDIIDKRENLEEQLMYYPNANLTEYPLFEYHVKSNRIIPMVTGRKIPDEILDLPIRIVNDILGRDSITLRELAGDKVLVLDFWAKWCSPCLKSMDKWKKLQPKYSDHVQSVGLMLDYDFKAKLMIEKMGWNMPQLIGPEVYLLNYYFCAIPVTGPSAWIKNGILMGITDTKVNIEPIIEKIAVGDITIIPEKYTWKSPF